MKEKNMNRAEYQKSSKNASIFGRNIGFVKYSSGR